MIIECKICCFDVKAAETRDRLGIDSSEPDDLWLDFAFDLSSVEAVRVPGSREGLEEPNSDECGIWLKCGDYLIIDRPYEEILALWKTVKMGDNLTSR